MNGRELLYFSKRERNGIMLLLLILALFTFLPRYLFPSRQVVVNVAASDLRALSENTGNYPRDTTTYRRTGRDSALPIERKRFTYERGAAYAPPRRPVQTLAGKRREVIEINAADTAALIALPGIGSRLAARIVLFRDRLGGFVRVEQLGEVYGLRDSVLQIILPALHCDPGLVKKIAVNTADKETLKAHPYIRWAMANELVNYRSHHGPFRSPADLLELENADTVMLKKLGPYLTF